MISYQAPASPFHVHFRHFGPWFLIHSDISQELETFPYQRLWSSHYYLISILIRQNSKCKIPPKKWNFWGKALNRMRTWWEFWQENQNSEVTVKILCITILKITWELLKQTQNSDCIERGNTENKRKVSWFVEAAHVFYFLCEKTSTDHRKQSEINWGHAVY